MIRPGQIDLNTIGGWPVAELGVSNRIISACRMAGIERVAQLPGFGETPPTKLAGMGTRASRELDRALGICERLADGSMEFTDLGSLLSTFLSAGEFAALSAHYALNASPDNTSAHKPLRDTAAKLGISHECVRNLVAAARRKLHCALPHECLRPAVDRLRSIIVESGKGAIPLTDIPSDAMGPMLHPFSARGAAGLLCDYADNISRIGGLIVAMPGHLATTLENRAVDALRTLGEPATTADIFTFLKHEASLPDAEQNMTVLDWILANSPKLGVTRDGKFFLPEAALPHMVKRILQSHGAPVHYLTVMRDFNTLMNPGMRRGKGHILRTLGRSGLFTRVGSGYYSNRSDIEAKNRCGGIAAP